MILKFPYCIKCISFSNLIIFALMFIHATPALADVLVKLNCRLDITFQKDDEIPTKNTRSSIIEVSQSDDLRTLIIKGDEVGTISTTRRPDIVEIKNTSNSDRWQLENKRSESRSRWGSSDAVSITIDRITGQLVLHGEFKSSPNIYITKASGLCEKIDATQKKF